VAQPASTSNSHVMHKGRDMSRLVERINLGISPLEYTSRSDLDILPAEMRHHLRSHAARQQLLTWTGQSTTHNQLTVELIPNRLRRTL
jgi:hypothetical protein